MEARAQYGPWKERPRLTVVHDAGASYSALPHAVLTDARTQHGHIVAYAVLQMHWWQGGECWASHETLAAEAKCSVRQLQRYLKDLVAWGFVIERRKGHGQAKAYAEGASNTTPVSPMIPNTTPVSEQHDTGVASNTTPVSDPYKKTPVKKKHEEKELTGSPALVAPDGAERATATTAAGRDGRLKVAFASLSEPARLVVDDWRRKQGRARPPQLNPTQAAYLEEAVADLGVERLQESNTWAAENGVAEFVKALRAARTKRRRDEEDGLVVPKPHANGTGPALIPATDDDRAIWARVLDELRGEMSDGNFGMYLAPLCVGGRLENGGLCLIVPPTLSGNPMMGNFRGTIRRALLEAGDARATAVAFKARRPSVEDGP